MPLLLDLIPSFSTFLPMAAHALAGGGTLISSAFLTDIVFFIVATFFRTVAASFVALAKAVLLRVTLAETIRAGTAAFLTGCGTFPSGATAFLNAVGLPVTAAAAARPGTDATLATARTPPASLPKKPFGFCGE